MKRVEFKIQARALRQGCFWLLLACLCFATPCRAGAEVAVPVLSSPVIDDAAFFSKIEKQGIEQDIRQLFQAQGPQLQVWTLPSLEGEPIESLSIRAVDAWKLGREGKDDGLLLTIARSERRYRLEVGRGLEGVIPDIVASRMLKNFLQPALRRSQPATGVGLLITQIARLTLPDGGKQFESRLEGQVPGSSESAPSPGVFLLLLALLIPFAIIAALSRGHQGFRRGYHSGGWSGRGGWGGGGGGGGWSGGGGGFSGGGSSGGW